MTHWKFIRVFQYTDEKKDQHKMYKYETRHQLHVIGPTIKDIKHQIDYLLKMAQRRFH